MKIIEVKDLKIRYVLDNNREIEALKGITIYVEEGEILGIVGESGSGKSTLAHSILNILPSNVVVEGEIIFSNRNLLKASLTELNRIRGKDIAFIPQDPLSSFNPVLTVGYQFEELLKCKMKGLRKKQRESLMYEYLSKVKVGESKRVLRSYPHQLSGGLLQRVFIAMAIVVGPKLIVADEPTSSLDVTIESQILHLFKELKDTLGISMVFITHNLEIARLFCDRIGVIYKGELVDIGDREEIFALPKSRYTQTIIAALNRLERDVV